MALYSSKQIARFWSNVDVRRDNACWPWRASKKAFGHGRAKVGGKTVIASRVAWEIFYDEPLGERWACHSCDNPECCNPKHIYAGTPTSNSHDRMARGRHRNSDQSGERNGHAKLTAADVAVIKARIGAGEGNTAIAGDFGVSHHAIYRIRAGKAWADTK